MDGAWALQNLRWYCMGLPVGSGDTQCLGLPSQVHPTLGVYVPRAFSMGSKLSPQGQNWGLFSSETPEGAPVPGLAAGSTSLT